MTIEQIMKANEINDKINILKSKAKMFEVELEEVKQMPNEQCVYIEMSYVNNIEIVLPLDFILRAVKKKIYINNNLIKKFELELSRL